MCVWWRQEYQRLFAGSGDIFSMSIPEGRNVSKPCGMWEVVIATTPTGGNGV